MPETPNADAGVTVCPQCQSRYNTANMPVGKRLQCGKCQATLVVGRATELVDHLVEEAVLLGASDIHIEPLTDKLRVRFRIDGVLQPRMMLAKDLQPKILSRVKLLSDADIAERRLHQDGRFKLTFGDNEVDLRMSSFVTVNGENIVLRILNKRIGLVPLDDLGFPARIKQQYMDRALDSAAGVIVITGPTGSGKTTTLYSSIDYCNSDSVKIITAEDPVEYQIDGVMQCSINEKIGLTFSETLKSLVRQDPDIVVLGEIRDPESAQTAIQAALTGHQVFTTFHTEDSIGTLLRLMDMGVEPYLLASTIICALGQRLTRRICPDCKTEVKPKKRSVDMLGIEYGHLAGRQLYAGKGCAVCRQTGYRGRIGLYEALYLDDLLRQAVMDRRPAHELRQMALAGGEFVTMKEVGIARTLLGQTTLEEVWAQVPRGVAPRDPVDIFRLIGDELPAKT